MKIMTINLWSAMTDVFSRLDRVAEAAKTQDIVCFQEGATICSGYGFDSPYRLMKRTGYKLVRYTHDGGWWCAHQIGILSRFPVTAARYIDLGKGVAWNRGVAVATINGVDVVSVHIDWGTTGYLQIAKLLPQLHNPKTVLAGDFNVNIRTGSISGLLRSHQFEPLPYVGYSAGCALNPYGARQPHGQPDWVVVRGFSGTAETRLHNASDHCGVFATVN